MAVLSVGLVTPAAAEGAPKTGSEGSRPTKTRARADAPATREEAPDELRLALTSLVDWMLERDRENERTSPAPAPVISIPAMPSRNDVQRVMKDSFGSLARCAEGEHGLAWFEMTVQANGDVRYVKVSGTFAGTPAGSCMARILRNVRFPAFSEPEFVLRYPARL